MIAFAIRWLLLLLAVLGLLATAVPAVPADTWWVRYLDFPRLEFLAVMLIVLAATLLAGWLLPGSLRRWTGMVTVAALLAGIVWDAVLLGPYLLPPVLGWPPVAVAAGSCPGGDRLRVLEANVQMTNKQDHRLLEMVRAADPDIAWFQETDAWWEQELSPLSGTMPYGKAEAQPNYFGVHLFSKLPLRDPQVRNLTSSRNPSIFTAVALPSGDVVKLYAVHPRPPQVGQGTAERDAQLMATALAARGDTERHVLLGDLNSVPWEEVVRRTGAIGNLRDPRVGRGSYITWNANDTFAKWPLDHILPGPGFTLASLRVLPQFGSDHHPLLADLCRVPGWTGTAPPPLTGAEAADIRDIIRRGQGRASSPQSIAPAGSASGPPN
jgi:endonuclease/exonuclease/phosphatase (EEP) superfamily protein YafD